MSRLAIVALCLVLGGCSVEETPVSGVAVYVDPFTGCQYVTARWAGSNSALTPRLGTDGKAICKPLQPFDAPIIQRKAEK